MYTKDNKDNKKYNKNDNKDNKYDNKSNKKDNTDNKMVSSAGASTTALTPPLPHPPAPLPISYTLA